MTAADFRKHHGLPPPGESAPTGRPERAQIRMPKPLGMNKTEAAYFDILLSKYPASDGYEVKYEPLTFRLPSSARYTPDFVVFKGHAIVEVVETKGGYIHSAASLLRFKEAVATYPAFKFTFAQRRKTRWMHA